MVMITPTKTKPISSITSAALGFKPQSSGDGLFSRAGERWLVTTAFAGNLSPLPGARQPTDVGGAEV
jgi:hypothetical protein